MLLTIALGLGSVFFIMLQPVQRVRRVPIAALADKVFASMLFCLAGVAGSALRERLNWQAAILLFGFCLACLGDAALAVGPLLGDPERTKNYALAVGAVPFFFAHVLNLVVLISRGGFSPFLLAPVLILPALFAGLWKRGTLKFGKAGVPLILYAALLGALISASAQTSGTLRWLTLPAACLFAISDTSLFCFFFGSNKNIGHKGARINWLVMCPYYLAQALMACAVIFV